MNELLKLLSKDDVLYEYILAIDNYMDDANVLVDIGQRIGIYIPPDEQPIFVLYYSLEEYINKHIDPKLTEKIINMTYDQYKEYINRDIDEDELNLLYSNRLLELSKSV